jgi:hypothetical protein
LIPGDHWPALCKWSSRITELRKKLPLAAASSTGWWKGRMDVAGGSDEESALLCFGAIVENSAK